MSFHPEIHYSYLHPKEWEGKQIQEIADEMEELREKVKEASGYVWDNNHFFIDSIFGRPALKILFMEGFAAFWSATNNCKLNSTYRGVWTHEMTLAVDHWIKQISDGLTQCADCDKWVKEYQPYSFAGAVCKNCYDPKKHLPPDTR